MLEPQQRQNRHETCHEHDNHFDVKRGAPQFPKELIP